MKRTIAAALISALPLSAALAQAPDKNHPPQKAMDSATPDMKHSGDKSQMHGPQKAMDSATTNSGGSTGASSGDGNSGTGATYNAQDANDAAAKTGDTQKLAPENAETQGFDKK